MRTPAVHSSGMRSAGWPDLWLRDVVNLMSQQRRKHWHSVRKGACVWVFQRREGAARQTLSPGDRADPGLASVRGLDWLGPNRRREGCIHVHQTYRHAARSAGRRSPAQGPLSRRPADAQGLGSRSLCRFLSPPRDVILLPVPSRRSCGINSSTNRSYQRAPLVLKVLLKMSN